MSRSARLLPLLALAVGAACSSDRTGPDTQPAADCRATDTAVPVTNIAVGEVKVVSGSALNCVRLPGDGARYIGIVADLARGAEVAAQGYRLSTDGITATSALQSVALRADIADVAAPARLHDVHERLMLEARKLDLAAARAARAQRGLPGGVRGAIFPNAVPTVGTTTTVRVPSLRAQDSPCAVFSTITATVRHVSQRAIILVDNESPENGFSDADLQSIAAEFDALIYSTDVAYFGTGSDEDANEKIVILYTPKVNAATPRNSGSLLAGFFWAGDLFPRGECNQSNGSELFYLLVPDPTGIHSSARTVADVREKTRGTIAHEFQHMLNAGYRFSQPAARFEAVWLDEALAHFAEEAVGRAKLGVGDFAELTHAQVADVGNGLKDYNAFFFQNLVRYEDWLRSPNSKSPMSQQADTSLAVRGAAWALLRYAIDHFSNGDARAFTRSLVMTAPLDTGTVNLANRLGGAARLDSVLTGWMVASYADNVAIPNRVARSQFVSWHMRDAVSQAIRSGYPLTVDLVTSDGQISSSVRSGGGARFFDLPVAAANLAVQVADNAGNVGFPGAALVLLRTQ